MSNSTTSTTGTTSPPVVNPSVESQSAPLLDDGSVRLLAIFDKRKARVEKQARYEKKRQEAVQRAAAIEDGMADGSEPTGNALGAIPAPLKEISRGGAPASPNQKVMDVRSSSSKGTALVRSEAPGQGGPMLEIVTDPIEALLPMGDAALQSFYDSDEPEVRTKTPPPENCWRTLPPARTHDDASGAGRKRFERMLKMATPEINASRRLKELEVLNRGKHRVQNVDDKSEDPLLDEEARLRAFLGGGAQYHPQSRPEAEQFRVRLLNDRNRERRALELELSKSHPVFAVADPQLRASSVLLSKTIHQTAAAENNNAMSAEERQRRREWAQQPWSAREEQAAPEAARLEELPWMTRDRVRAIAKQHTRDDRAQVKKQMRVEKYLQHDGRIDYNHVPQQATESGATAAGGSESASDRASSIQLLSTRGRTVSRLDRASSMRGSPSPDQGSLRDRGSIRGTSRGPGSVVGGRSKKVDWRYEHLNEGNARNSALTIGDLQRAQELLAQTSDYGTHSVRSGPRSVLLSSDDGRSSRNDDRTSRRMESRSVLSDASRPARPRRERDVGDSSDSDESLDDLYQGGADASVMPKQVLLNARSLAALHVRSHSAGRHSDSSGAGSEGDIVMGGPDEAGWYAPGDERLFHVSPRPERRIARATNIAESHRAEERGGDLRERLEALQWQREAERQSRQHAAGKMREQFGQDHDSDTPISSDDDGGISVLDKLPTRRRAFLSVVDESLL